MAAHASGRVIMTPGEPKSVLILQNLPVVGLLAMSQPNSGCLSLLLVSLEL